MSYTAVQTMFDPLAPTGRRYYVKAPFLREIQDGAIEALVDAFAEVPSPASIILLQQKSGAMARGRADQTAFGHREDQFAAVLFSGWDDPTQAEANTRSTGLRDRIEREGDDFFERVDAAYRGLAAMFPERVVALDGTRPPDEIAEQVLGQVRAVG